MLDASLIDITHAPPVIGAPLFAVLFWWITTALGDRLLRLLRMPWSVFNVWERGLLSAAVGTGVLQLLPLTLSALGWMRPLQIRIAFAALAVVLVPDLLRVSRRFIAEVSGLRLPNLTPIQVTWWSLFLIFMGVWFVHSVTFGTLGDDDGIHLAAPKRWLEAGTLRYLPTYSLTNATLGFDMVYLIAMSLWSPIGAKILHYSAGIFALLTLVQCARRMSSPVAGLFAISLLLVATPVSDLPVLFGSAMIDLAACWMTMMTVLVWLAWRERPDIKLLVVMAACAGFAASFKLTSVQVAIAWIPILVVDARRRGTTWLSVLGLLTVFGFVTLAMVLPWFGRNALLTGNPLYPMLSNWIPTRDWTIDQAANFGRYVKYYSWGVAAGSRLDQTERTQLVFLTAGLVVAGGITVAVLVKNSISRSLVAFATVFALISVALTGLIFRYWMPATMCVALVVGTFCAQRWSRRLLWPASLLLVMALGIQVRRGYYFHQPAGLRGDLRMAAGLSSFEREYANDPFVDVWRYINSSTPPDSRVLLAAFYTTFGASSYAGFWIDRQCYTTDSHLQGYFPLNDWGSFRESISRSGVTHVVISDQQFSAGRLGFVFQAGQNEYPFALRLVQEDGDKLYQSGHLQVYSLRKPARDNARRDLPSGANAAPKDLEGDISGQEPNNGST